MNTRYWPLFSWVVTDGTSPTVLNLRGELDLAAIGATRVQLLDDLEGCEGPVVVDATELEFIDSTGIRLLLELKRKFDEEGRSFSLGGASPAVERVISLAGIRPFLENGIDGKPCLR